MQRFLSAVVIVSVGALVPAYAAAQSPPAKPNAAKPATAETAASKKPDVHLSDEAELSRVVGLYEAGKYRECGSEIERLLDPLGKAQLRTPSIVENARVYWAACLLGAGDGDAADVPLRAAIHENPQMKPPDNLVFPQPVVDHFLKVRDSLVNEIRAAEQTRIKQAQAEARQRQLALARDRDRMRALEQLARQETIVVRNRRSFAYVPFGVGQFQNRDPVLGYTLLVSEALLSSASLTAIIVQTRLQTQADDLRRAGHPVDDAKQQRNYDTWSVVKTGAFWAFAAVAVGGIVQAQLEFVPEFRETRSRPLPPALAPSSPPKPVDVSAAPYFDPTGGGVTLLGRF
ncbi:MAG TPA: hypothetical protein VNG33_10505 [Polyangiaceae bacterium]|nr:hypothetical protein [Polyangiaceae bacterium]